MVGRVLLTFVGLLLSFLPLLGQTTESSLKRLYPRERKNTFIVRPGIRMKAIYGSRRKVCVLTISGPILEPDLMRVFETAVPKKSRGLYLQRLSECMGLCIQVFKFEKVELTLGVIGNSQKSEPSAVVIFRRPECEAAAKEVKKISFYFQTD